MYTHGQTCRYTFVYSVLFFGGVYLHFVFDLFKMSSGNNKRKKKTLTLEQKVEIIQKLDRGVQGNRLAIDYDVSKSAITYIKSQKENILSAVANTYQVAKKKSLHKP